MNKLIASYQNGNYRVSVYEDGTKIRQSDSGDFFPEFPESIDLKITNRCNLAELCVYCHEMSNNTGRHARLDKVLKIARGLPAGVEIAIGGGNPLAHPELDRIVEGFSSEGLIVNLTVNQEHYNIDRWKDRIPTKVKGVGISFRRRKKLNITHNHVIHHLILGVHNYDDFLWLCSTYYAPKILWLGFKTVGNGNHFLQEAKEHIRENLHSVKNNLHKVLTHTDIVAFDNLAIEQLSPDPIFSKGDYMGDDGKYSFYYDAVEDVYSIGSSHEDRISANGKSAPEIFKLLNEGTFNALGSAN